MAQPLHISIIRRKTTEGVFMTRTLRRALFASVLFTSLAAIASGCYYDRYRGDYYSGRYDDRYDSRYDDRRHSRYYDNGRYERDSWRARSDWDHYND
jgi:hypothetical protein